MQRHSERINLEFIRGAGETFALWDGLVRFLLSRGILTGLVKGLVKLMIWWAYLIALRWRKLVLVLEVLRTNGLFSEELLISINLFHVPV